MKLMKCFPKKLWMVLYIGCVLWLEPLDVFSYRFRRYQNGALMPTSYGDHLDRAAKSLCKDLGVSVTIELFNTQAIKVIFRGLLLLQKVISSCVLTVDPAERSELIEWLVLPNDVILKSERYENLINDACLYYYKEMTTNISEDTLAFVRRSANELLRNKASKEALRKKLVQAQDQAAQAEGTEDLHPESSMTEMIQSRVPFVHDVTSVDPSQITYLMNSV